MGIRYLRHARMNVARDYAIKSHGAIIYGQVLKIYPLVEAIGILADAEGQVRGEELVRLGTEIAARSGA